MPLVVLPWSDSVSCTGTLLAVKGAWSPAWSVLLLAELSDTGC